MMTTTRRKTAAGAATAMALIAGITTLLAQSTPGVKGGATPNAAMPELMTPAQVAQVLGVGESDVVASLESGDLKGKRIGTQWRVTRAAVDAFLHS